MSRACASESVNRNINYMQSDWAIGQAANILGLRSDHDELIARATNYKLLFDKDTKFFRPLYINGSFPSTFDEFAWGGDYTESGPWQYRFYVMYDPAGLAKLYSDAGGDVCNELERAQTIASTFHLGGYGNLIHEMTEMTDIWGQFAMNNQPSFYMLYMFGAVDTEGYTGPCAARGQYWLRQAMLKLYNPSNKMFPGDEDNGSMAAWYILSSLGLYELSPGGTDYALGAPLFQKVVVNIEDGTAETAGRRLTVSAKNNSKENVYVQAVYWNGQLLGKVNSISYDLLRQGGELSFEMGPSPASGLKDVAKVAGSPLLGGKKKLNLRAA